MGWMEDAKASLIFLIESFGGEKGHKDIRKIRVFNNCKLFLFDNPLSRENV